MARFTPAVRSVLVAVAALVSALAAQADSLPQWMQITVAVAATLLAGLGIIPPTVPTRTVVAPGEPAAVLHEEN